MTPMAAVPAWVWATLLMVCFVVVSAATMWLARYAVRQPGSSSTAPSRKGEEHHQPAGRGRD